MSNLISKVASRWLKRKASLPPTEQYESYDKVIRLAILEGVAQAPKGSWYKHPRMLSKLAENPLFAATDPKWFSDSDTKLARGVIEGVAHKIQIYKIHGYEVLDIINPLLASTSPTSSEPVTGPFYALGMKNSHKVLSGKEPPQDLVGPAIGFMDVFLTTIARTEHRREKTVSGRDPKTEEGAPTGYEEVFSPAHLSETNTERKLLADLFSVDHPIYRAIKLKWSRLGPKIEYVMYRFIAFWSEHPYISDHGIQKQMAQELGVSETSITNWKNIGFEAARKILVHPKVRTILEKHLIRSGLKIATLTNRYLNRSNKN